MEDVAFFCGLMICYDKHRQKSFIFLLELAKYLITRNETVRESVKELIACLPNVRIPDFMLVIAEQVRWSLRRFEQHVDARCKEEIEHTVRGLIVEPTFSLMEIERSLAYHGNHLETKHPKCYFQFFTCFGFLCTGVAMRIRGEHIVKIVKEAEKVMNTHADTFPGFQELYKYAEESLRAKIETTLDVLEPLRNLCSKLRIRF